MYVERWCDCCRERQSLCKCTPDELNRHYKTMRLDDARAEVTRLERELGIAPTQGGNRHERRAAKARGRRK